MTTILDELAVLRGEFASLPDGFARYTYLAELSALLSPPGELRRDALRYTGCQSQVWLSVQEEAGCCRLEADSDTLIIRGFLYLLRDLLDGQPVEAVLAAEFDLLDALELGDQFQSQRAVGVAGLLPEIKRRLTHEL